MPQVFPRAMNAATSLGIVGSLLCLAGTIWALLVYTGSSYGTNAGVVREQAIPFSHEHHVGVLKIDCRYCHDSVERSGFAGMPATKTCMNCHSQMWVGSEMLEPVRDSYKANRPLHWNRVHNVPGFVHFDHSIHLHKGIGCSTCHGRVDEMPLTFQKSSLLMEWCLDCHRHPQNHIRPREDVFDMHYAAPENQTALGERLCREYDVADSKTLTGCTTCHR